MKHILYYVVEKLTQDVGDDIQELTGWKTITVYDIIDNKPDMVCTIEGENINNTEEEISDYLNDNGYGDTNYELKIL